MIELSEPTWDLPPFTHVRHVGWYDTGDPDGAVYRAALLLVLDGQVVAARVPVVIGRAGEDVWDKLEARIHEIVDRLAALPVARRLEFFARIGADETTDVMFFLGLLEETQAGQTT